MPRSRWLALIVAALLCVLGGANRGRVPAHEREGSRTADEPAALTMRRSALDRSQQRTIVGSYCGIRPRLHDLGEGATEALASAAIALVVLAARQLERGSASSRGPPQPVSLA